MQCLTEFEVKDICFKCGPGEPHPHEIYHKYKPAAFVLRVPMGAVCLDFKNLCGSLSLAHQLAFGHPLLPTQTIMEPPFVYKHGIIRTMPGTCLQGQCLLHMVAYVTDRLVFRVVFAEPCQSSS
jgi:hypothetical protein